MQRIPAWQAIVEIVLTGYVLLSVLSVLAYAPFWLLGGMRRARRHPAERSMRAWPLAAALSLIAIVGAFAVNGDDVLPAMGNLTVWSGAVFVATITFAVAAVGGAYAVWQARGQTSVRRAVHLYSLVVSASLLVAAVYFAYWGIIGWRTWA